MSELGTSILRQWSTSYFKGGIPKSQSHGLYMEIQTQIMRVILIVFDKV